MSKQAPSMTLTWPTHLTRRLDARQKALYLVLLTREQDKTVTHADLAADLGVSLISTMRLMKALAAMGLVKYEDGEAALTFTLLPAPAEEG